ncbi:hypothetical protein FNF27_01071 [Cafeteria roenbergensis]|uniref:Uncharacterized protein n=3 Tax=Cafeteria roenbergensis TaxID=33653 RepID=A0A5A8EH99_CAFRO|nr:hypothetical protein FNF27_01071 [Cafeteria roenbergensis]
MGSAPFDRGPSRASTLRLALAPGLDALRVGARKSAAELAAEAKARRAAARAAVLRNGPLASPQATLVAPLGRSVGTAHAGGMVGVGLARPNLSPEEEALLSQLSAAAKHGADATRAALRRAALQATGQGQAALGRMLLRCSVIEAAVDGPVPLMLCCLRARSRGNAVVMASDGLVVEVDTDAWAKDAASAEASPAGDAADVRRKALRQPEEAEPALLSDAEALAFLDDADCALELAACVQNAAVKRAALARELVVPRPMLITAPSRIARAIVLPFAAWYFSRLPDAVQARSRFSREAEAASLQDAGVADAFWKQCDPATRADLAAEALEDAEVRRGAEEAGQSVPTLAELEALLAAPPGSAEADDLAEALTGFVRFLDEAHDVRRPFLGRCLAEAAASEDDEDGASDETNGRGPEAPVAGGALSPSAEVRPPPRPPSPASARDAAGGASSPPGMRERVDRTPSPGTSRGSMGEWHNRRPGAVSAGESASEVSHRGIGSAASDARRDMTQAPSTPPSQGYDATDAREYPSEEPLDGDDPPDRRMSVASSKGPWAARGTPVLAGTSVLSPGSRAGAMSPDGLLSLPSVQFLTPGSQATDAALSNSDEDDDADSAERRDRLEPMGGSSSTRWPGEGSSALHRMSAPSIPHPRFDDPSSSSHGLFESQSDHRLVKPEVLSRREDAAALRGAVTRSSRTRALRGFMKENKALKSAHFVRRRNEAANRVMQSFLVKVRLWRRDRAKAGEGALRAHYEGVSWAKQASALQLVEASAAALDRRVRDAAVAAGISVPCPEDARWMRRAGGRAAGAPPGSADIGGDGALTEADVAAAGKFSQASEGHAAASRRLDAFVQWYATPSGDGATARAAFLSRELFAAAADVAVRRVAEAALAAMDGKSTAADDGDAAAPAAEADKLGASSATALPVGGTSNRLARLLGDLEGWERRWEDPLLRVAAGLVTVKGAAQEMRQYMQQRAGATTTSLSQAQVEDDDRVHDDFERAAHVAWRRWVAFRRWYQSVGAQQVRARFLRRRAAQALRWCRGWKGAAEFSVELDGGASDDGDSDSSPGDEKGAAATQDGGAEGGASDAGRPAGSEGTEGEPAASRPAKARLSAEFLPAGARLAVSTPGSRTGDPALVTAGGMGGGGGVTHSLELDVLSSDAVPGNAGADSASGGSTGSKPSAGPLGKSMRRDTHSSQSARRAGGRRRPGSSRSSKRPAGFGETTALHPPVPAVELPRGAAGAGDPAAAPPGHAEPLPAWAIASALSPREAASAATSVRVVAVDQWKAAGSQADAPFPMPNDVAASEAVRRDVGASRVDLFAVDESTTRTMEGALPAALAARAAAREERRRAKAERRRKRSKPASAAAQGPADSQGRASPMPSSKGSGRSSRKPGSGRGSKQTKRKGKAAPKAAPAPQPARNEEDDDERSDHGHGDDEDGDGGDLLRFGGMSGAASPGSGTRSPVSPLGSLGGTPAASAQATPRDGHQTGAQDLTDEARAAAAAAAEEERNKSRRDWGEAIARRRAQEDELDDEDLAAKRAEEARIREEEAQRRREAAERAADPDGLTAEERRAREEALAKARELARRQKLAEEERLRKAAEAEAAARAEWLRRYRKSATLAAARGAERLQRITQELNNQARETAGLEAEDRHSSARELLEREQMERWRALEDEAFRPFRPAYADDDWPVLLKATTP